MAEITVDFGEVIKLIQTAEAASALVGREIQSAMSASVNAMEQQVVGRTPKNTGLLQLSIYTRISGTPANLHGIVATNVVYAEPVEYGRKPGKMPPSNIIEMWVIRKGIAQPPESEQVALLIARAIGRRGTEGAHMFEQGFEAALPTVENLWRGLPARVVQQLEQSNA